MMILYFLIWCCINISHTLVVYGFHRLSTFRSSSASLVALSCHEPKSSIIIQPNEPVERVVQILRDINKKSSDSTDTKPSGFDSQMIAWINTQSEEYQRSSKEAKTDINLLGNYVVSYVGTGKDQRNEGNPAGGRYRGVIGRLFFETQNLYQNLLKGDDGETIVVNIVKGRLFKLIPFCVILFGIIRFLSDTERENIMSKYGNKLSSSTVFASFRPPVLCFGSSKSLLALSIKVGPPSSVVLDTPYVCPEVRLGLGSRGSYFVFTRTLDTAADEWKTWLSRKHVSARQAGSALVLLGALLAFIRPFSASSKVVFLQWGIRSLVGVLLSLLGLFISMSSGGIIENDTSK